MKKAKYDFEAELVNQREDDVIFLEEQVKVLEEIVESLQYDVEVADIIEVAAALRERANTEKLMLLGDKKVKVKNG